VRENGHVHEVIGTDRSAPSGSERERERRERGLAPTGRACLSANASAHARGGGVLAGPAWAERPGEREFGLLFLFFFYFLNF
jgi:hypothetical protein